VMLQGELVVGDGERVFVYRVGGQVGHSDGTCEYMRPIDRLFALGFIVKLLVRFQSSPLVTRKNLTCLFVLSAFCTCQSLLLDLPSTS
jgi:hypothetical protein